MPGHHSKLLETLVIVFTLVLLGCIFFFVWAKIAIKPVQMVCTNEAKLCSDGSYVGRTGPNCEFAACPSDPTEGWQISSDSKSDITFKYPEKISADYITPQDWPPKVLVSDKPFSCIESSETKALQDKVVKKYIAGRIYCITTSSEGAAGSTYVEYTYMTDKNGELITVNFILRYPQCLNYDDPRQTECKDEQQSFDLDGLIDRVAQSAWKLKPELY